MVINNKKKKLQGVPKTVYGVLGKNGWNFPQVFLNFRNSYISTPFRKEMSILSQIAIFKNLANSCISTSFKKTKLGF